MDFKMLTCLSVCVWGTSRWSQHHVRVLVNQPSFKQAFSISVEPQHQNAESLCSIKEGKASTEINVFKSLSMQRSILILGVRLPGLSTGPKFQVRAVCSFALSGPCKHILMAYWDCQRGNSWKCFWECWLPYCSYPDEETFNYKWVSG